MEFLAGFSFAAYWLLLIVPFMIAAVAYEFSSGFGLLVALAITAVIFIFGEANPFVYVWNNLGTVFLWVLGYIALGAVYSVFKWFLYVRKNSDKIKDDFETFKSSRRGNPGGEIVPTVEDFKNSSYNSFAIGKNKMLITGWMVWWVPSLFATMFSDLLMEIWNSIYAQFGRLYSSIANSQIDKTLSK